MGKNHTVDVVINSDGQKDLAIALSPFLYEEKRNVHVFFSWPKNREPDWDVVLSILFEVRKFQNIFFYFDRPRKNWDMLTARESALKCAKTDDVLILDSDVYIRPGQIDKMVQIKRQLGVGWVTDEKCIPKDPAYARVAQCTCLLIDRKKALRAIERLPMKDRAIFSNGLEDGFITIAMRGGVVRGLEFSHFEDIKKWYRQIDVKKALKKAHPVLKPLLQYVYEREKAVWDKEKA